jgi:hypothetical protein
MNDEEAKLRWLMSRQPRSVELAYYLIFLLAANARYDKALEECRRVLESRPDDLVARVWSEPSNWGTPGILAGEPLIDPARFGGFGTTALPSPDDQNMPIS